MKDHLIGDKPLRAGDGDTKSRSKAGFVVILVCPIRHGVLMISLGLPACLAQGVFSSVLVREWLPVIVRCSQGAILCLVDCGLGVD